MDTNEAIDVLRRARHASDITASYLAQDYEAATDVLRKLVEREKALTDALEAMREYVVAQKGLADYPLIADAALALHKEDA